MLNEPYKISKLLKKTNDINGKHRFITNCPSCYIKAKKDKNSPNKNKELESLNFNVYVGENGDIVEVDTISDISTYKNLSKGGSGGKFSFPSLRIDVTKIDKLSKKIKDNLLPFKNLVLDNIEKNENTKNIFTFYEYINKDIDKFIQNLTDIISEKIDFIIENKGTNLLIVFGINVDGKNISLNKNTFFEYINNVLQDLEQKQIDKEKLSTKVDSFGNSMGKSETSFEEVSVGKIKFKLYARNASRGCKIFEKYGLNGIDAFPISLESKRDIATAIIKIRDPQNNNIFYKTYKISDNTNQTFMVFSDYDIDNVGNMFFDDGLSDGWEQSPEEIQKEEINESIHKKTKNFIKSINGENSSVIDKNIYYIFTEEKMDKGCISIRILSSGEMPASEWQKLNEKWVQSTNNYVSDNFFDFGKRQYLDNEITLLKFLKALNKKWTKSAGIQKNECLKSNLIFKKNISIEEVRGMFMNNNKSINKIIHILSENHINLLLDFAYRSYSFDNTFFRNSPERKYKNDRDTDLLCVPVIMSMALFYKGLKKEDYQYSTPFMVGKLLASIDLLHFDFLNEKEKKRSTLISNSFLDNILRQPKNGLLKYLNKAILYLNKYQYISLNDSKKGYLFNNICFDILPYININDIQNTWTDIDKILISLGYFSKTKVYETVNNIDQKIPSCYFTKEINKTIVNYFNNINQMDINYHKRNEDADFPNRPLIGSLFLKQFLNNPKNTFPIIQKRTDYLSKYFMKKYSDKKEIIGKDLSYLWKQNISLENIINEYVSYANMSFLNEDKIEIICSFYGKKKRKEVVSTLPSE